MWNSKNAYCASIFWYLKFGNNVLKYIHIGTDMGSAILLSTCVMMILENEKLLLYPPKVIND